MVSLTREARSTVLALVVPCYNEEQVLPHTAEKLLEIIGSLAEAGEISRASRLYFVDDGSVDRTWQIIGELVGRDSRVVGVKLTRNVGHQCALLAGLMAAKGDALVSIDADLQDDINVIEDMVREFHRGHQVVLGVRKRRETDTIFKRTMARAFYRLLKIFGVEIVKDHADFRLLGRAAVEALREFGEVNMFLRGLVPLLGFKSTSVYYDRRERFAGESKYPIGRMMALAVDGITSFSVVPLRVITLIGFAVFLVSALLGVWVFWARFFAEGVVPGWASTVLPIYFIGGVQLLCIGVLGEYAGKIYTEVKRRPRFIVERILESKALGAD